MGRLLIERNGVRIEYFPSGCPAFLEIFVVDVYEQVFKVDLGDIVIDVGAGAGDFVIKAAREVGDTGRVVAIEPDQRNIALCRYNVERNGLSNNVEIIAKAAGSRRTKAQLYLSSISAGHHSIMELSNTSIEVDMDSLDNIASELGLSHVDFIKIDAEGAELEILKGTERLLGLPNIKLAIAAYHPLPDGSPEFPQVMSFLTAKGFKVYTRDNTYIHAIRDVREKREE